MTSAFGGLQERLRAAGLWPTSEVPVLKHVEHAFLPDAA